MEDANTVSELFKAEYGSLPQCVVRAPGRVNIIGEHIDYNGYSVLPIAIQQSITIAAATNDDQTVRFVNHFSDTYPSYACKLSEVSDIKKPPSWYHYALCGVHGVLEDLQTKDPSAPARGMNMAILGRVPAGAGLSSSSALVCGGALVTATLMGQQPTKDSQSLKSLAQLCAVSEKYVGTQGGGMDQAASLLSQEGCAQLISFNPLRCEAVALPSGASFVVANSLNSINKAATGHFNERVVECRLACRVLGKMHGVLPDEAPTLALLQGRLGKTCSEMLALVDESLHEESYTVDELCQLLELSEETLKSSVLSDNTKHLLEFKLKQRARHVFSEALRVYDFKKICDNWSTNKSTNKSTDEVLRSLGELMFASHASAKDDYECSHEALDTLVELSRRHAYGARLTGAGWGGCTVALVAQDKVAAHLSLLKEQYYQNFSPDEVERALFTSPPATGAQVTMIL